MPYIGDGRSFVLRVPVLPALGCTGNRSQRSMMMMMMMMRRRRRRRRRRSTTTTTTKTMMMMRRRRRIILTGFLKTVSISCAKFTHISL